MKFLVPIGTSAYNEPMDAQTAEALLNLLKELDLRCVFPKRSINKI